MYFPPENDHTQLPPAGESERAQLFEKISAQLDIQPREKRRRRKYRAEAAVLYAAPRILLLALILAAALLLLSLAQTPPSIENLEQEVSPAGAQVSFTVSRLYLAGRVSASLNGKPLPVSRPDGVYRVELAENGQLSLSVTSIFGGVYARQLTVSGIDREAPHISGSETVDGGVRVYLTDGEAGSGVDWAGITASLADGRACPVDGYDEEAGYVFFSAPEDGLSFRVPDNCGNILLGTVTPA